MLKQIFKIMVILSFVLVGTSAWAGNLTIPNTFTSGTTAGAGQVNNNFTAVETEVDDNNARITTNASGISTNAGNITTNASGISTNTSDISANTSDISTNASDISANASDISANDNRITDLETIQVVGENRAYVNSSTTVTNDTLLSTNFPVAGNLLVKICFSCVSFSGTTHTRWDIDPRVDGTTQSAHQGMVMVFPHADVTGTPGASSSTTMLKSVTAGNHTIGYYASRSSGNGSLDCDISASAIFFPGSLSAIILQAPEDEPIKESGVNGVNIQ